MQDKERRLSAAEVIAQDCLAVRVRTLNRAVNALYDDALRAHGVRVGQLNLMVLVARMGVAKPGDLCRILRMDKSTLSRDVELIRRNGWLEVEDAADARARPLRLSAKGLALLDSVLPAWQKAQDKAKALIGRQATVALRDVVDRIWKETNSRH
jgi:DNA-binding MarR family transcriptional regulator